jgi:hypothetical protein
MKTGHGEMKALLEVCLKKEISKSRGNEVHSGEAGSP